MDESLVFYCPECGGTDWRSCSIYSDGNVECHVPDDVHGLIACVEDVDFVRNSDEIEFDECLGCGLVVT
jgi:hypothetical protein